jgi:thiaminase/transcriptional activator TenA
MALDGASRVSLSAALWTASADQAAAALEHPFVAGLGDGSLPLPAFQTYGRAGRALPRVLRPGVRASGSPAAATGPTLEAFADLVAGVLEELRLHAAYAERWGTVAAVEAAAATSAYTDFLLATGSLGEVGETCAAMAPCMRLYAHLGQSLDADAAGPYASGCGRTPTRLRGARATLEDLLDRHAQDGPACAGPTAGDGPRARLLRRGHAGAMSGPVDTPATPAAPARAAGRGGGRRAGGGRRRHAGAAVAAQGPPPDGRRVVLRRPLRPARVDADGGLDIGPHPHTGLSTVTYLLDGQVLHRDSLGSEQVIRPGQLNLMTAGRGSRTRRSRPGATPGRCTACSCGSPSRRRPATASRRSSTTPRCRRSRSTGPT